MMNRFMHVSVLVSALCVSGCVSHDEWVNTAQTLLNTPAVTSNANGLSTEQITLGLKEALRVGTQQVVTQLGRSGGYNLDPKIRIALPEKMQSVHTALSAVGMGGMTQDLQNKMNEAAELAVPEARALFISAIQQMTIADARSILSGQQQDAATQYLRRTMGADLGVKIQPIIEATLAKTGAMQAYDRVMGQYDALPFVAGFKTDLQAYVRDKALDGVFYYVGQEEIAIRQNPAKRTSEILRTVFAAR